MTNNDIEMWHELNLHPQPFVVRLRLFYYCLGLTVVLFSSKIPLNHFKKGQSPKS